MEVKPDIICVNETWLTKSIGEISLEGYVVISRRDRNLGEGFGGGILTLARSEISPNVTELDVSETCERSWVIIHTDQGPYLVGNWYRPPRPGEINSILSFGAELEKHRVGAIGCVLVGDINVHHSGWLRHSAQISVEGRVLHEKCLALGLRQCVQTPTREAYLLDLVLTDLDACTTTVLPCISDHKMVQIFLKLIVPVAVVVEREVWDFRSADWDLMRECLEETDWAVIRSLTPTDGANLIHETIFGMMERTIKRRTLRETKSTHPWLTDEIVNLVAQKNSFPLDVGLQAKCSEAMMDAYYSYAAKARAELQSLKKGSKAWWSKSRLLLAQKSKVSSIPALKDTSGKWILVAVDKANLFAKAFSEKNVLPEAVLHEEYATFDGDLAEHEAFDLPSVENAERILSELSEDSGTGPDLLPSRILKLFSRQLALPLSLLAAKILETGVWPEGWRKHWIVPLYKKKSVYQTKNYRGIHLTAQISKVVERIFAFALTPFIERRVGFGPNQFAYQKQRGARDALALLVISWVSSFSQRKKVGLYCSDVSGAFDRVAVTRLVRKLRQKGLHPDLVLVIESWLAERSAEVTVDGTCSEEMGMFNMVFQGTVLGPPLWNLFFEDSRLAINKHEFTEIVYADDLNAHKEYDRAQSNELILRDIAKCQSSLHAWGGANQVTFDPAKESFHILAAEKARRRYVLKSDIDRVGPSENCIACTMLMLQDKVTHGQCHTQQCRDRVGELLEQENECASRMAAWRDKHTGDTHAMGANFRILGINFDCHLRMADCADELRHSCQWKLRTLMRTQRFYSTEELTNLYKSQILSYVEYRTPAIYHACDSVVSRIDWIQDRFLKDIGVSDEEALLYCSLAPLTTRRDIAMLGLIHRTVLGQGPPHFKQWVQLSSNRRTAAGADAHTHCRHLVSHRHGNFLDVLKRSFLGLVDVYNLLPEEAVQITTVQDFQRYLQELVKEAALSNVCLWRKLFSPRHALSDHPLKFCPRR